MSSWTARDGCDASTGLTGRATHDTGRLPADLVHCDIKPQNLVFFSSEQIWKLIDLATVVEEGADVPAQYTLK